MALKPLQGLALAAACVLSPAASAQNVLLNEGGMLFQMLPRCAETVPVSGMYTHASALKMEPAQAQVIAEKLVATLTARCPQTRTLRLDLLRGQHMIALDGTAVGAVALALAPPSAAPVPQGPNLLAPTSPLPSLASASSPAARCGVLAQWMETTLLDGAEQEAFRDEHMRAVFGRTFDDDNTLRMVVHDTEVAACVRPKPRPAQPVSAIGLLRRVMPDDSPDVSSSPQAQRVKRLEPVLREVMGYTSGPRLRGSISAHVLRVRQQYATANQLANMANRGNAEQVLSKELAPERHTVRELTLLLPADRERLLATLTEQRARVAMDRINAWLDKAQALPRNLAGAAELHKGRQQLAEVMGMLTPDRHATVRSRVEGLLDEMLAPTLSDVTQRVARVAATREGARTLVTLQQDFERQLHSYGDLPSVQRAYQSLLDARNRVLPPLLPAWQAQLAATPARRAELDERRDELVALFGAHVAVDDAHYAAFKAPLDARADELVQRLNAEEKARRARERQAARAAAAAAGLALKAEDFKAPGGPGSTAMVALYSGDFQRVGAARGSAALGALADGYIAEFSGRCREHLVDAVQLTEPKCTLWQTQEQNYREVSRHCIHSINVPTGVFAERSLLDAKASRHGERGIQTLGSILSLNPKAMMGLLEADAWDGTARKAVAAHACTAPALKRLRVNLEAYFLGKPAVMLDGVPAGDD
ncbi:hypothetical protein ACG04Q_21075 [Roseateles sp. DXS20W]|uniref:Uncharacterized protein n=1 Tax=Pelomonas lactea TaxID=3299030 RepID=A0ABW7GQ48_9BURK